MPDVTGNVKDIFDEAMASQVVELVFRLNEPHVRTASGAGLGTIYPTAERRVKPSSAGFFSANLTQTDGMLADAWYELGIVWNGAKEPLWDFPQWQIRVTGAGTINQMITLGPPGGNWGGPLNNLSLVLVSTTRPDNLQVGQLWLQATPGEETNPNPALNTGKLFRGIA